MNRIDKIAMKVVAGDFSLVVDSLTGLKHAYAPTSDEAIFLGIVRDMAVHVGRGNLGAIDRLAGVMKRELSGSKMAAEESKARTASGSLLEPVLSDSEVAKLEGVVDEQTYDLAVQVYMKLRKDFELSSAQNEAINRMKQSCDRLSSMDSALHRNNIFKAAHALGIHLPSSMF